MQNKGVKPGIIGLVWTGSSVLMLLALIFVLRSAGQNLDIRSKAAVNQTNGPSLSLTLLTQNPDPARPVDIGVWISTGGQKTAEADLSITYDPEVLWIGDNDIELLPAFSVLNVEKNVPGTLSVDMFIPDSVDDRSVASTEKLQIAVLHFSAKKRISQTEIGVNFKPGTTSASGLYLPRAVSGGTLNILTAVEGVAFPVN